MFQINKMPATIDIGIIGETNFRTHQFDMSAWMKDTPDGVPSIVVIRPTETAEDAYIAATEFDRETNVLSWTITAGDLGEVAGEGVMRIWLEEEDNEETIVKRGKSVEVTTIINEDKTRDPSDEPPEAQEAWMEQMTALKVATVDAAADADDAKDDAEAAEAAAEGSAEDAEAYAIGKRGGEDVTSGDPAYHNNSKYYAIKAWEHAGDAENAKIDAVAAKNAAVGAKNDAVQAKNDAVSAKGTAEAKALVAEGFAVGQQNGVDVASGSPYYQNNAKYYSGNADSKATAAGNSATTAGNKALIAEGYAVGKQNGEDVTSGSPYYQNNAKYYSDQASSTLSSKADKVSSAVSGNFAGLDSNGNLTDSGSKASDFLTEHQDISGKADKDTDAVEGNLAEFDSNGNPVDSGKAPTDFVAADDFYATEMPMSSSDSTKVSEAVSGLKSALKGIRVPYSFPGKISTDGVYTNYTDYIATDYVPINNKSTFSIVSFFVGPSNNAYSFYDKDKTFISGQNSINGSVFVDTIPSNARYVRFCSAHEAWRNLDPTALVYNDDLFNEIVTSISENNYKTEPLQIPYVAGTFIGQDGNIGSSSDYATTGYIPVNASTKFSIIDVFAGESTLVYAFYDEKYAFISGQNSYYGNLFIDTIPATAKYVRFGTKIVNGGRTLRHIAVVNNFDILKQIVEPINTNFFDGYNLYKTIKVDVVDNMVCDANGIRVSTNVWSMIFPAEPNTDYYLYIPEQNRQKSVMTTEYPAPGGSYTFFEPILYSKYDGTSIYRVTTNSTAKYMMFYFYSGTYDLSGNKDNIIITKDGWNKEPKPTIKGEYAKRHYGSFSILGDSYSTFEGYLTPSNAGHWYPSTTDNNVTEIEQTWWYKFANQYGCALKENVSWTGSTISYDGYGDGHADGKTISFITRMANITNPELILVYGGTNDSWVAEQTGRQDFLGDYKYSNFTESDFEYFRPSVAYVLTELKKKHVGSHIVFMLNSVLANIRESVQVICEHLGVPLCEMYSLSLTNGHPNQTGMQQIADYITAFLKAGN